MLTPRYAARNKPAHRRWAIPAAGAACTALALLALPGRGAPVWVERTAFLMGAPLTIQAAGTGAAAGMSAIEAAFDSVAAWDRRLSTWRDDTELAHLNRSPVGAWIRPTPAVWDVLAEVRTWRRRTHGAFDPALGALVDAWDLRGEGRRPTEGELARAAAASGLDRWAFADSDRAARRTVPGTWIDAGGFGKGVALDAARAALRARGVRDALLNFGGQVVALGRPVAGDAWPVVVADPRRRDLAAAELAVRDRSVATSAQAERFVTVNGTRYGHVLDPATGRPVPAWGSVSVVHEEALVADILATALLVMGPTSGLAWADTTGVAALFLVVHGTELRVRCSRALQPYLPEAEQCR